MQDIVAFSFKGNISQKVLGELPIGAKVYVEPDENAVRVSVDTILINRPSYVLGLGEYSGRDNDKLRIETICSNKFRNHIQGNEYETIQISDYIQLSNHSKLAAGIGNSYCNLISFLIMEQIQASDLPTQYAFIHIPKRFGGENAVNEINQILKTTFFKD